MSRCARSCPPRPPISRPLSRWMTAGGSHVARNWKHASSPGPPRPMIGYALKRFLGAVPTLFIIVTIAFFMMRAAPGGPFDAARKLPPEIERNIKIAYNLDKPLIVQYG